MTPISETLDHATLSRLIDAEVVSEAHVTGQVGGWALSVKYGVAERFLAAQRTGKLRLFRKLESVLAYLKTLGISRFDVDASAYAATTRHKRPDRSAALKRAHEAAEHDAWFRAQVETAVKEADSPDAVFVPHEVVMAELRAQIADIETRAGKRP